MVSQRAETRGTLAGVRIVIPPFNGTVYMPAGTDEEKVFQTFRNYLEAVCSWTDDLYPHSSGVLHGLAGAVKAQPWRAKTQASSKSLTKRASEVLRNAWATEVLLNSPRVLGNDELIGFSNLWAPVQAYYTVFHAIRVLEIVQSGGDGPTNHQAVLQIASSRVASPSSPFVTPWTARVLGSELGWRYEGFGGAVIDETISNLSSPNSISAPSLLAKALKTTRQEQIAEHREGWLKGLKTGSGSPRKTLPTNVRNANAERMRATTLFDLLWRLRRRSNYKEGDGLLTGALGPTDAANFHAALSDVVAATLLPAEIYLAHLVGAKALADCAHEVPVPSGLENYSVWARVQLW